MFSLTIACKRYVCGNTLLNVVPTRLIEKDKKKTYPDDNMLHCLSNLKNDEIFHFFVMAPEHSMFIIVCLIHKTSVLKLAI